MSYLDWHVGMKVVCVDDRPGVFATPWIPIGGLDGLAAGRIYTIRQVNIMFGEPMVFLCEIVRPRRGRMRDGRLPPEIGYAPARFRPVQTHKTDISLFTAMLNPKRERVDA